SLAYEIDSLIHLNEISLAKRMLNQLAERQRKDGSVSARPDASWVSSVGLAHLALCWHRSGQIERCDKALTWIERHQRRSGGFLDRSGWWARLAARTETAWTIKWYLDAHYLRMLS